MRHKPSKVIKTDEHKDTPALQPMKRRFNFRNMFRSHRFIPYFQDKGLSVQDLPKAIICHELMGYCMLGLTWAACYHFPISDIPCLKAPMEKVVSLVPKALTGPVAANPFLSSKYGQAYMESSCLRRLLRPITLPGKLYLTYKMVQILPDVGLPPFCTTPVGTSKAATNSSAAPAGERSTSSSVFSRTVGLPKLPTFGIRGGFLESSTTDDESLGYAPQYYSYEDSCSQTYCSEYVELSRTLERNQECGLHYQMTRSIQKC